MSVQSLNFEFLRKRWPELADLGGFAEAYAYSDPQSTLVKLRVFAEHVTKNIYHDQRLPKPYSNDFIDLLKNDAFIAIVPSVVIDKLHALRIHGNKAAHSVNSNHGKNTPWLLKEAFDIARWIAIQYRIETIGTLPKYKELDYKSTDPKNAKLKREKREILEKYAAKEAENQRLLAELEAIRGEQARLSQLQTKGPAKFTSFMTIQGPLEFNLRSEEIQAYRKQGNETANLLEFNEVETRARIVNSLLVSAGWTLHDDNPQNIDVGTEVRIIEQAKDVGNLCADYVLWDDDGSPLAVIEIKKTSINSELGRQQAKLYADGLEKEFGQRPVIFYSNGFDIWIWDDINGYPPRKLFGYYSKDSLQYLVKFQRHAKLKLSAFTPRSDISDRLYQLESIKRITERFENKHRKGLIVQATGTGKTRVAIALTELLIRSGWAKRVLFLCDRRELRRQAKNAFTEFLPSEPIKIIKGSLDDTSTERVFVATYPAMKRAFQSFDVGYFDLIIADESHRSIYNVFGDIFKYFDALQIGLTATPIDFVTKSTFELFNCEGQKPTSNYGLDEAIEDGYLVPFEVFEHTTQFMREGINLDTLSAAQIQQLEDQGEDPAEFDFSPEQINASIFNKDTNRAIIRNLMEAGLRDRLGQHPGKSIIFARSHDHAVLLCKLFNEMYPQFGGKFCQVIDTYDPMAEQLIDDFKSNPENKNDILTVAISVDMLDTGIDIPEIVNLVFAKPVKSPVKFWQMIGRGTRLCKNLYGIGKDKQRFRIFDHWGNFDRFHTTYQPASSKSTPSLRERLFMARLSLAETTRRANKTKYFESTVQLIENDIKSLPENSISIREKWREKRMLQSSETLRQFRPETIHQLKSLIAPLMQWCDIRGQGDAYSFDLQITEIQLCFLSNRKNLDVLRIAILNKINMLQTHLTPVKEKTEIIRLVKSSEFWDNLNFDMLEEVRKDLRDIMKYSEKSLRFGLPIKTVDLDEDHELIYREKRDTSFGSYEMKTYRNVIEAELSKHFNTDSTLLKIRRKQPVNEQDLQRLVSLILTQSASINLHILEEFFSTTTEPLEDLVRSIIGLDADLVEEHFSAFIQKHPNMTAKQTKFLGLLKSHISRYGSISKEKLYEAPFISIDADGPDGIFERSQDVDELFGLLETFDKHKLTSNNENIK